MSNIIWLDENVDIILNKIYSKELESMISFKVKLFKTVLESINYLKTIQFEETKIIVSGRLYSEFVNAFKENIIDMYVIPEIIVFTRNREKFIQFNPDYYDSNNKFYNFGGIAIIFDEIKKFLNNGEKNTIINNARNSITSIDSNSPLYLVTEIESKMDDKSEDIQLSFDYIGNKSKLIFPLFFKILIEHASNEDLDKYNNFLFDTYSNNNNAKKLLAPLKIIPNIPIELLSKYYARLYTINCKFHYDLNEDLRLNKKSKHLAFIKTLYEGVKLKSLPLCDKNQLYRGAKLSKNEIKLCLENKNENLPGLIVFSRSFLSFTKDKKVAENFLNAYSQDKDFSKVIFILEKADDTSFNLATHGDIEKISFFTSEKEVLFFPFSSFEIKESTITKIGNEEGYEIKLVYLGKYFKDIKNDTNLISKGYTIPDSEFKKLFEEFGLIQQDLVKNINSKILYNLYNNYEKGINNIITGEIKISEKEININVNIINSFENIKKENEEMENEDDFKYLNEKEIKENIEIIINEEKIDFNYYHKFKKKGNYKIQYLFKNRLSKTNHMFNNCKNITSLDFSLFNTKNVTNMKNMFTNCTSLKSINLSKFNTQKVADMAEMFSGCKSLTKLDLSNFNTEKVKTMNAMFYDCQLLIDLNISKFDTQNVIDIGNMFKGCKSLSDLNLSNFNTQNVKNMNALFFGCNSLKKINLSNFDTQNVIDMNWMFSGCTSLTNLNLSNFNTQNVKNMNCMFSACTSLEELNVSNFNTQNVTEMSNMFFRCISLKNLDLSSFTFENVIKMDCMFYSCKSLTNLNISKFNFKNVIEMRGIFHKCNSLKNLDLSHFKCKNITDKNSYFENANTLADYSEINTIRHFTEQNNNVSIFDYKKKDKGITKDDLSIKNYKK